MAGTVEYSNTAKEYDTSRGNPAGCRICINQCLNMYSCFCVSDFVI